MDKQERRHQQQGGLGGPGSLSQLKVPTRFWRLLWVAWRPLGPNLRPLEIPLSGQVRLGLAVGQGLG